MAKLIQLEEAAKLLGMSAEDLTEMRSRNEIFGYRDGASWKFKYDEIERVAQEKGITLGAADASPPAADDSAGDLDLDGLGDAGESDSILVSDEELGQSDESTASTIIGEADDLMPADSDLQVDPDGSSALRLASDSKSGASDVELSVQSSDVLDEGGKKTGPGDTDNLQPESSSVGDDLSLNSDSGSLELSLDELGSGGSELNLSDSNASNAGASASGFGSAIDLELDDDELVLGSSAGSDVTSGSADSGISLNNPSDSGLSLEEPADLAGGSGGEMLELGEDSDMMELDEIASSDSDELQSDDDFLLTPVDEGADEDADSGSQVIALDSEEFDDSAVQMLSEEGGSELDAEPVEFDDVDAPDGAGFVTPVSSSATATAADSADASYSVWNVLSLFSIVVLLGFAGVLMLDLMTNIWSWQGTFGFNSTIMDGILSMLGS